METKTVIKRLMMSLNVFLAISLLSACGSFNGPNPIISGRPKFYTQDEALNMFNDNRKVLNEIAQILLTNETFWENVKDKQTGTVADIYHSDDHAKQYFSEEDWGKIIELFNGTSTYLISRRYNSVITFAYKFSDIEIISFYYFDDVNTNMIQYRQGNTHFDRLDDNWYVGYGSV